MTTDFAKKTSTRIPFQLPEFIRSDKNYETFVKFIQAYYEWMEQQNDSYNKKGVIYGTQNLLNYQDLNFVEPGETFIEFVDYYVNQFLPKIIVDFNMASSGISYDKRSYMSVEMTLFQKIPTPINSDKLLPTLNKISEKIILDVFEKDKDFKFYKRKS